MANKHRGRFCVLKHSTPYTKTQGTVLCVVNDNLKIERSAKADRSFMLTENFSVSFLNVSKTWPHLILYYACSCKYEI